MLLRCQKTKNELHFFCHLLSYKQLVCQLLKLNSEKVRRKKIESNEINLSCQDENEVILGKKDIYDMEYNRQRQKYKYFLQRHFFIYPH